jgi:2-phosphoglycerate kinase
MSRLNNVPHIIISMQRFHSKMSSIAIIYIGIICGTGKVHLSVFFAMHLNITFPMMVFV